MKLGSRIIAKILTLCGISLTCTACYVGPSTMFTAYVDGMVVADDTEQPIEGIQISCTVIEENPYDSNYNYSYPYPAILSDKNGKYVSNIHERPGLTLEIVAEDIDGPANGGEFETQTKSIALGDLDYKLNKKKSSYDQFYEATKTVDFRLELKTEDSTEE